jgi:tetratricopeptide (TPR) repeat protein
MRNPMTSFSILPVLPILFVVLGIATPSALAQPEEWETDAILCRDLTLEPPLRIEACARALKAPSLPANAQVNLLSQRAMALDELGDYKRAVQDYDAAIVLKPGDPSLYLNRGVAKIRGGSPAAAIPDYDEAIRLKPDWHLPYFDRAVALSDLGQRAAALADYQRAIDRDPTDAWIYVGQGDVHAAGGDAAAALAAYDKALALRPELEQAHMRRAKALLRLNRPQEAVTEMDRALAALEVKRGGGKASWLQIRAAAKFALADFAGAIADLAQAREGEPKDTGILRDLAQAYLAAGDAKNADAAAKQAVEIAGEDAANLLMAGRAALADGRGEEAKALASRASMLRPGDAQAQALLAVSLPRGAEATKAAQVAADFAPQDAELQAVARYLGAQHTAALDYPAATPAEQLLAACVAALRAGDADAAKAAGAGWSLCHLAAVREP